MAASTWLCDLCTAQPALLQCAECGDMRLCADCGVRRHRLGTLQRHAMLLIFASHPVRPVIGAPCAVCEAARSTLVCPACDAAFCVPCANSFHTRRTGPEFQKHIPRFVNSMPTPPPLPPRPQAGALASLDLERASSDSANKANWKRNLGRRRTALGREDLRLSLRESAADVDSPAPSLSADSLRPGGALGAAVQTFKLASYGLGISDAKLQERRLAGPQHFVCFDHQRQTLSIFGKRENNSLTTSHTRAFRSIKQALLDPADHCHISVYFSDTKPVAQCLAMNKDEGEQIAELLRKIADANAQAGAADAAAAPLFRGQAEKRGKMMSWSARWIVIRVGELQLLRDKDALVPLSVVPLRAGRCRAEASATRSNQLVLRCPERDFVLRVGDEAERDTVVALLERAIREAEPASPGRQRYEPERAAGDDGEDDDETPPPSPRATLRPGAALSDAGAGPSKVDPADRMEQLRQFEDILQRETLYRAARPVSFGAVLDKVSGRESEAPAAGRAKIALVEEKCESDYAPPSRSLRRGIFQLMRLLAASMRTGSHVTAVVFAPKAVWFQHDVKFQAYNTKVEALELLQQELLHVSADALADAATLEDALLRFRVTAEEVQNRLATDLSFIHSCKSPGVGEGRKRGIWEALRKRVRRGVAVAAKEKVGDTTKYVRLLLSVLESAAVFEPLAARLEGSGPDLRADVAAHVQAILEFLRDVVCSLVLYELKSVTKRYIKHCTRSIIEDAAL